MGNKRNKRVSTLDFFKFYPYKINPPASNTIPQPYIKEKDTTPDHKFALEYQDWRKLIDSHLDYVSERLLQGKEHKLGQMLGKMQLRKYKVYRKINYAESKKQGKKIYYKNPDNYTILLKWYRDNNVANFNYKYHWRISMSSTLGRMIFSEMEKDPSFAYTILDT